MAIADEFSFISSLASLKMEIDNDGESRRFALLQAVNDSEYAKKVYGGYFNLYVETFGEEGERWDLFRVYEGHFPDFNQLYKYDGFVITGSPSDAYANDSWILKLCFMLQTLDAMQKKILGICFGHQVICRALGGRVGKSSTGWDIGIRKVHLVKDLATFGYLEHLKIPASLSIVEVHQDEVFEVPPGAEVIASSEKTQVEMFAIADHILGIQKGFAEDLKCELVLAEPDKMHWGKICRNFLKGKQN